MIKPSDAAEGMVRYAVVGLGHIAQAAVLPAFKNASENSRLAALVSDDRDKREQLAKKYKCRAYSYDQYEECLQSGEIDAVFIALPNHLHCDYTTRAAAAGVHVLCEKPMAVTAAECEQMIAAARTAHVRLMIAYRLHFEAANLQAIEIAHSGQLGDLRVFDSSFCMQVKSDNVRTEREAGGGALYDIGIYCLNAARYLFRDEPSEVCAFSASKPGDPRFAEIEEMVSAVLRFPDERLATFTCSFGAADVSSYRLVGTDGDLRVEPAYEYQGKLLHHLTVDGKTTKQTFAKRDQFAPELIYFSRCILEGREPEPSGEEGLIDVRIIEALYESAARGTPVALSPMRRDQRPHVGQQIDRPPVGKVELVKAESASQD
jgi:glucose-fructose oxidoreductase